jgi:hypothetical protein
MCLPDSNAAIRPLCDSRSGNLHAGKLPFMRCCLFRAQLYLMPVNSNQRLGFALRLAEVSLSRLGEGRRTVTEHAWRVSTTPAHLPFRKFSKLGYLRCHLYTSLGVFELGSSPGCPLSHRCQSNLISDTTRHNHTLSSARHIEGCHEVPKPIRLAKNAGQKRFPVPGPSF